MRCSKCNKEINNSVLKAEAICSSCYVYFVTKKQIVHDLPEKRTIVTDEEGRVVCHICGRAYHKIGNHAYTAHDLTTKEYKIMHELPQTCSLASHQHQLKMREYNIKYREHVVLENLVVKGTITRFQPGEKHTSKGCIKKVKHKVLDTLDELTR